MPVSTTNKALPAKEPKKRSFREFAIRNRYIWLSFLIPFVLMATAFALMSVSPFGDKQILVTDLWHQYFPFLADFQYKPVFEPRFYEGKDAEYITQLI